MRGDCAFSAFEQLTRKEFVVSSKLRMYLKMERMFFRAFRGGEEFAPARDCFFCHCGEASDYLSAIFAEMGLDVDAFFAKHTQKQKAKGHQPFFANDNGILCDAPKPLQKKQCNNICIASGTHHLPLLEVLHTVAEII